MQVGRGQCPGWRSALAQRITALETVPPPRHSTCGISPAGIFRPPPRGEEGALSRRKSAHSHSGLTSTEHPHAWRRSRLFPSVQG